MRKVLPIVLISSSLFFVACGDEKTEETTTTVASTTTEQSITTTTTWMPSSLIVWPQRDVVFATPEEAATDFISNVLGVSPRIGEFQAGDSLSGEIEVFINDPEVNSEVSRSTLLLRKLGPNNSWFVVGAVNPSITIDQPVISGAGDTRNVYVTGKARGFEGLVTVEAFVESKVFAISDSVNVQAGSAENPEPYSANLSVTKSATSNILIIVVRGGVGLEQDPGEFSVIAVPLT